MTDLEPSPSTADRSLLRAIRAWGGGDFARYSSRLSEGWRDRLRPSWPSSSREKPDSAWGSLRSDHEASARPDPSRVHPSWFVRALKGESLSVRLTVAANAPRPLREALRRGLNIDPDDLGTDREPDPEVLACALALWAERLVGDVAGVDADPPVVVALSRLAPRELARMVKVCGLVKHAFAIEGGGPTPFDESIARFTPLDRVRVGFFRRHIREPDARLVPLARQDLWVIEGDRRRAHARVGLLTFARLLSAVEPHRARWALQHIPYPLANWMRVKEAPPISTKALLAWESWVLEAAWSRLFTEGRLAGGQVPSGWNGEGGMT